MFAQYKAAYAPEGAAAFSIAGFVSRMSIAIYPIMLVLIVSARTGDYGFGGAVSGLFVMGEAIGNPVAGTLVDRFSQHRMLPRYLAAHVLAAAVMAVLLNAEAPLWAFVLPAMLLGATMLNVGALVRARWSYVWPGADGERSVAYSVESILDEVIFVFGPLIGTVLATHTSPYLALAVAVCLIGLGSLWLATQRSTEPPASGGGSAVRVSALRNRGMTTIILVMAAMGAVMGSAEVDMVAFCGQHGNRAAAGWVLAGLAGGSAVAGLAYGSRRWKTPLLRRFVWSACIFGLLPLLYFAATSIPMLAVCTAVVGLGIAPTLIGGFGLVDSMVPVASLTEGLTWIGTGLSVGFGTGAAVVGGIADAHGARVGFCVPVGAAFVVAAFALLLAHRMAPSRTGSPDSLAAVTG